MNERELEELENLAKKAIQSEEGWEEVHIGKVALVNEKKAVFVKGHYRKVNGKRVWVKPYYRRKVNPARR
jgi:hypothetical protein